MTPGALIAADSVEEDEEFASDGDERDLGRLARRPQALSRAISLEEAPASVTDLRARDPPRQPESTAHLEEHAPEGRRAPVGRDRVLDIDGEPHAVRAPRREQ
jgi:hypothetical protein